MSKIGRVKELLGISSDTDLENLSDYHREVIEEVKGEE